MNGRVYNGFYSLVYSPNDVNNSDAIYLRVMYVVQELVNVPPAPAALPAWAGGVHCLQSTRRVRGESSLKQCNTKKFCDI